MSPPPAIALCTTDEVPGRRIATYVRLVQGSAVRAHVFTKDFTAALKNLVGGEIEEYTKLMAEAREQALDRLLAEARASGADAVVGLRFASTEITSGAAEVLVYGTAVVLARPDATSPPL